MEFRLPEVEEIPGHLASWHGVSDPTLEAILEQEGGDRMCGTYHRALHAADEGDLTHQHWGMSHP